MKQTAVEWLFEQVWITSGEDLPELLEQAKEMEKQQQVYSKEDMEIAHEIAVEVWNNYIARPNNDPEKHRFSFKDLEKAINLKLKENVEKDQTDVL
jgi:hypothetical protein